MCWSKSLRTIGSEWREKRDKTAIRPDLQCGQGGGGGIFNVGSGVVWVTGLFSQWTASHLQKCSHIHGSGRDDSTQAIIWANVDRDLSHQICVTRLQREMCIDILIFIIFLKQWADDTHIAWLWSILYLLKASKFQGASASAGMELTINQTFSSIKWILVVSTTVQLMLWLNASARQSTVSMLT